MRTLQLRSLLSEGFDDNCHKSVAMNSLGKLAYVHIHIDYFLKTAGRLTRHEQLKSGIKLGKILDVLQLSGDRGLLRFYNDALVFGNVIRISDAVECFPHQF